MIWHSATADAVARHLRTDAERGLTAAEALRRRIVHGENVLTAAPPTSAARLFLSQFRSVVVWILLGAAGVSTMLGEPLEGSAIMAIVVLNACIGFVQEHRAERAVTALTRMAAPRARVVRDGRPHDVAASELVLGDVLMLDAGDLVGADARLLEATALRAEEASLTGESTPVTKDVASLPVATPVADRRAMVFLGTKITNGGARAIVVATGMATEMGRIATMLDRPTDDRTPLQTEIDRVGRQLLVACLVIVAAVAGLGIARGAEPFAIFLAAVSLAVAAIPEGLPAVITVALALGVQRMARRHALVRRLPAVETLGSANVVCTDKTGTLTVGAMTARQVVTAERVIQVSGEGYGITGDFRDERGSVVPDTDDALRSLLTVAAGCVEAHLQTSDGRPSVIGDPTEGALLTLAAKGGIVRSAIEATMPRLATLPFDPARCRMTVVRRNAGAVHVMMKGAPEVVVARCTRLRTASGDRPLDDAERERLRATCDRLAASALRVLALAERRVPGDGVPERCEDDLTLLGFVAMHDPPRPEARDAVRRCQAAGVRPIMITGDHPHTAQAIGRELGIMRDGDGLLTGAALDALDDVELGDRLATTSVYARVTAEHKLRIVRAWRRIGAVVAMTGDGVNDAPALEAADIGVAMGVTGSEVTKQAADLILLDDDFATIVAAIEEGRGIYDNIRHTLAYLVTGNAAELAVMLVAGLVGWPLPLLPIHLLWINLVTDGLPALMLATEPTPAHVLERRPRPRDARLADAGFLRRTATIAVVAASAALFAFGLTFEMTGDASAARTAAFTVLVFEELVRSLTARSATRTVAQLGLRSCRRLGLVVATGVASQIALLHVPGARAIFQTSPVSVQETVAYLALATLPALLCEVGKMSRRRWTRRRHRVPSPLTA